MLSFWWLRLIETYSWIPVIKYIKCADYMKYIIMNCVLTSIQRRGMYQLKVYKVALLRKRKILKCFIILVLDRNEQQPQVLIVLSAAKYACTNWTGSWVDPKKPSRPFREDINFLHLPEIEPRIVHAIAYSLYLPVYEIIGIVNT